MTDRPAPTLAWSMNDASRLARVPPLYSARARPGVVLRAEQRDAARWAIWIDVEQPAGWTSSTPREIGGDALDAQIACEALAGAAGLLPVPAEHGWRVGAIRAVLGGLSEQEREAVLAEVGRGCSGDEKAGG